MHLTYLLECNLRCNPHFKQPVCGTSGVTYINECFLNQAICISGGKFQKARHGKCCKNLCSSGTCERGRKCVWSFKTCTNSCPCEKTCANVPCPTSSLCVHDSKTCSTQCGK